VDSELMAGMVPSRLVSVPFAQAGVPPGLPAYLRPAAVLLWSPVARLGVVEDPVMPAALKYRGSGVKGWDYGWQIEAEFQEDLQRGDRQSTAKKAKKTSPQQSDSTCFCIG